MKPNRANIPQRWIPMTTNAAIRSDWMKISLLRVGAAPPDHTEDPVNVQIGTFLLQLIIIK